ncbi:MAG: hypothetical protein AAGU17_04005 [Anaerolineaceae bacterium]|jgi:hypothetical protein
MNALIGKWKQPEGQAYAGLIFEFKADGTFDSQYPEMGIVSSGTYQVDGDMIHMDQTTHTFGLLGKFAGRFAIEGDTLKLLFGNPGEPAPEDLGKARLYLKI